MEKDKTVENFNIMVAVLMFMFNASFILNWTHLFMVSWNIKSQAFNRLLNLYGILICKKTTKPNQLKLNPVIKSKKTCLIYLVRA